VRPARGGRGQDKKAAVDQSEIDWPAKVADHVGSEGSFDRRQRQAIYITLPRSSAQLGVMAAAP